MQELLRKNARVYMASRQSQKSVDAVESLKKETGKDSISLLPLDLGDLHLVRKSAEDYLRFVTFSAVDLLKRALNMFFVSSKEKCLDVLINNAYVQLAMSMSPS